MDARFNHYGNPVGAKFQKYLTSAGRSCSIRPCRPRPNSRA